MWNPVVQVASRFAVLEDEEVQEVVHVEQGKESGVEEGQARRFIKRKDKVSRASSEKGENMQPLSDVTNVPNGKVPVQQQSRRLEKGAPMQRGRMVNFVAQKGAMIYRNVGQTVQPKEDGMYVEGLYNPHTVSVEEVGQFYGDDMGEEEEQQIGGNDGYENRMLGGNPTFGGEVEMEVSLVLFVDDEVTSMELWGLLVKGLQPLLKICVLLISLILWSCWKLVLVAAMQSD